MRGRGIQASDRSKGCIAVTYNAVPRTRSVSSMRAFSPLAMASMRTDARLGKLGYAYWNRHIPMLMQFVIL